MTPIEPIESQFRTRLDRNQSYLEGMTSLPKLPCLSRRVKEGTYSESLQEAPYIPDLKGSPFLAFSLFFFFSVNRRTQNNPPLNTV